MFIIVVSFYDSDSATLYEVNEPDLFNSTFESLDDWIFSDEWDTWVTHVQDLGSDPSFTIHGEVQYYVMEA